MRAILLTASAVLALSACSQQTVAQQPRVYGVSPAQAAASCGEQARRMQAAPELRVQGGRTEQETRRAQARVFLQEAEQAAAYGDERTCRAKLGAAQTAFY
jgi:hypothetical protein